MSRGISRAKHPVLRPSYFVTTWPTCSYARSPPPPRTRGSRDDNSNSNDNSNNDNHHSNNDIMNNHSTNANRPPREVHRAAHEEVRKALRPWRAPAQEEGARAEEDRQDCPEAPRHQGQDLRQEEAPAAAIAQESWRGKRRRDFGEGDRAGSQMTDNRQAEPAPHRRATRHQQPTGSMFWSRRLALAELRQQSERDKWGQH